MTNFLLHPCLLTGFADFIGTFNTEILYWVISDAVAGSGDSPPHAPTSAAPLTRLLLRPW